MKTLFFCFTGLFGWLFFSQAFALDYREVLYPKILKILEDERLILDLGSEDGIQPGQHARITFEDQYVGRLVSIDVRSGKSLWKMYRVISEDILEIGRTVKFRAMSLKKLPESHKELLSERPKRELEAYEKGVDPYSLEQEEEDAQSWRVKDREGLDKELNSIIEGERPSENGWVVGYEPRPGAFDKFNFELNLAPYRTAWRNREKEITYGLAIANDQTDKFETKLEYGHTKSESEDVLDGNITKYVNSTHSVGGTFVIKKIFGNFSYIGEAHYEREKDNAYYPQKHHFTGNPVGLRYDFLESERVKELSISYMPEIDYLIYEEDNIGYRESCVSVSYDPEDDNNDGDFEIEEECVENEYGYITEKKSIKLRHTFKFVLDVELNEVFSFTETMYHRPAHDFGNNRPEMTDANHENTFALKLNLLEKLSLSYVNVYTWDTSTAREQNIGSSNMAHEINLGVSFSI